ncbi:hypothetical protein SAMN05660662_3380 [Blastococcus aurantiacus]|uniref:Uncharacterized protein n=1 Tax=Blastococcus aurantiacus TaxID=1550231 RepID=A0A1G7NUF4_9ACTN|nr:hypothetical protein [Blastococcus aurantiacus]SDF77728.1 hypothetical protein SAMN05660662_3380 [Blastococcus aurantiacus]
MITFSRGLAQAYLVALAVWVAGFVAIILTGLGGGAEASAGPVAVLLTLLFGAAVGMLAVAVRLSEADGPIRSTAAPSPFAPPVRWLLLLGFRWTFLLCGVAAPTAFRTLDADR